jgi:hypothetical protein
LAIPKNAKESGEAGCKSLGANGGTGLAGLLTFVGDLNSFVQEVDGQYELLLLAHMTDWAANTPAANHKLQLYVGEYKGGEFLIDLDSFTDKDQTKGVKLEFDATVDECNVTTQTGTFTLEIAVTDGLSIPLELSATTIKGQVSGDDKGFSLSDTTISGYLSDTAVLGIVKGLKAACAPDAEDPPSLCAQAAAILDKPEEEVVKTILTLIKKYDTKLEGGQPSECDPKEEGSCNAVSVCLQIASEPVTISGLSAD